MIYSQFILAVNTERKRSIDVLDVLEEWMMVNGKSKKIMHENGKQFTSKIFTLMYAMAANDGSIFANGTDNLWIDTILILGQQNSNRTTADN
jgi:hypothetical protein